MTRPNNYRQHKIIIYQLKRNYGQPIVLRRCDTNTENVRTGEITRTYTDFTVKRAILLPRNVQRDFSYDLSFIAANKNFTYGGLYDINDINIMVERKDLKVSGTLLDVDLDWLLLRNGVVHTLKKIIEYEEQNVYLFTCSRTEGDA